MRTNKKIFLLVLISFFLLPYVFGAQVNASAAAFSDAIWIEEKYSTAQEATDAANSGSIEIDQTVAKSFQGNLSGTVQEEHQMWQFSSVSNSASFTQHIMCKDHDPDYNPIEPTTIFRPSDTKAIVLTTISSNDISASNHSIEFRWYYRSNSSKTWVSCHSPDWPPPVGHFLLGGTCQEVRYQCNFSIAGWWPGSHYPRAYKVEVYLDDSFSFSEFFEVTNGGLNSPRMCEDVDVTGHPVNMKSRFTIGSDTKAYHYLRFDKIAYFNDKCCHNFTTVWIQPNGGTYKTYSGNFTDYKDTNVNWNYWEFNYTQDDYIPINPSTPVGNWTVEVYLDSYYFDNTWKRYGPVATTPFIVGNETVADWTFMVYLDADINIEGAGIDIFKYMAKIGPSSQVNIVVQMDRMLGYDDRYGNWTDCKRFNVTKGMTPTPGNAALNLSEVNMGDPNTLKDFVNWTINNYPANYYSLVLWDHGAGFMGVCVDFNASDVLSLPELSQALSGLPAIMDVVLLDACSMSMTEIAYQIKDCANVLVGPEGLGYAPAPYDEYLTSLTSNPSMLPSAFAKEVVTDYIDWCKQVPLVDIPNATMSATDLTNITSLMAAIDDFAIKLKEKETPYLSLLFASHEQIILARNLTAGYIGPYSRQSGYYIDLYHFAQLTNQSVLDEELRNTADQMMTTLESIIITKANKHRPDSHGLSIFFPDENDKYNDYKSPYEDTTFTEDTPWDEFVKYHLSGYVLTIQTPYPDKPIKVDEEPYPPDTDGKIRVFVEPGSYTVNVTSSVPTGPGSREGFAQWNDNDTSNPRTLFVDRTLALKAEYETQYYVAIDQSGSDVTVTATIDESSDDLPVSFWWTEGSTHNMSVPPTVGGNSDTQYVFTHWNDSEKKPSRTITVTGPTNYTAYYKTQYLVTFQQTGSGGTPHVTVDDVTYSLNCSLWLDMDVSHIFNYESQVSGGSGVQYVLTSASHTSPITVTGPATVTGDYKTQYYLTVNSPHGAPGGAGWYDDGSTAYATLDTETVSGGKGIRYVFTQWSDDSSGTNYAQSGPIIMNAPKIVTANWKIEFYLTINTDPSGLTPQPNVSPPGQWYDNSTLVTCTAQKIRGYVFDHWTVDGASWDAGVNPITVTMEGPCEATAHYVERAPSSIPPLTLSLNKIEKGETITVSGVIIPAHEGVPVTLTYRRPDGSTLNRTVISSSDGKFSDTYTPDAAGTWNVTASWPGDDDNYGTTSTAASFRVPTRAWWDTLFHPETLQVILGLVAIAFAVTFVGTAWVRTRRSARARRVAEERAAVAREGAAEKKYKLVYRDLLKEYPKIQKRECRVAIAQIGVSKTGDFLGEFYEEKVAGLFSLREDKVEIVRSKVKNMIEIAHAKEVNILLFPELTVDLNYGQLLEYVASLAKAYGMYIIPGSYHDEETRQNISVVVGPDGILWQQEKHIPATIHHKGRKIKEGIDVGTLPRKTIVCNTEFGRIAIVICRDFLDMDLRVELKNFEPPVDLVFNPAWTPVTEDFKAAHFDARRSIYAYCFFANAAEFGDSFIYTPEKERVERKIPAREESLIYKDVDLFKLRSERKKWEKEQRKERRFIQSTR